jgi:hypothetical protein
MATDELSLTTEREYIAVRPTTDRLVPGGAVDGLRSLHGRVDGTTEDPPTVEMLLVTAGTDDGITYLFGGDIDTKTLERALRRCFPTEYELTRTTTSLTAQLTPEVVREGTTPLPERPVGGFELRGREDRRGDWQTRLQPLERFGEGGRADWPLADVISALADSDVPVAFQVLLQPKPDWTWEANATVEEYHYPQRSIVFEFIAETLGADLEYGRLDREDVPRTSLDRIEEIEAVNARQSFDVNARAVAFGSESTPPAGVLDDLSGMFSEVGRTTYQLRTGVYGPDSADAGALLEAIEARTVKGFTRGRRLERSLDIDLPFTSTIQPRIVADPTTAGNFCLVGGADLSEDARRAIGTRPGERTGQPLPPESVLDRYREPGYALGIPQTGDRDRDRESDPIALPPTLQRRHMLVVGQTGSGKSILGVNGLLSNHAATEGATVIIESKDGRMADDYERAHYATYGTLDDVYRFDAERLAPAEPFFDVTRQQESGFERSQAVEDVADHLEELLRTVMGAERFDTATTSPRIIEAVTKALFDPVHGTDQFSLADLQQRTNRFHETGFEPPVVNERLARTLREIAGNSEDTFIEIMNAATRRIEEVTLDSRVAPLFDYVPGDDGPGDAEPFDWRARLDEDCVIILDTSALRTEPQRIVTLVVLSHLWSALQRRDYERRQRGADSEPPLVNVHIEEAAEIATSDLFSELLKKGRSFGVALTLSMQYPGQLREANPTVYENALNNVGTVVTGRVEHDRALAERLATDDMPPEAVANRLRGLAPGEWLVSLPSEYGVDPPRPFQLTSLPLPPGHPDGPRPLTESQRSTFKAAEAALSARSRRFGIDVTRTPTVGDVPITAGEADDEAPATPEAESTTGYSPIDKTLAFTNRLPEGVGYHPPSASVCCTTCETRYGRTLSDLLNAIECHNDGDPVDRAAIPTVDVGLTLGPGRRATLAYSDRQLAFLQLVYDAHQGRYDPVLEYDVVFDSMTHLRTYAGLADGEFEELVTDGLLTIDTRYPHTLYTVTAEGRDLIGAPHRDGIAHGDGVGDLSESSFHRMMVEALRRGFESRFVADSDHPATEVAAYHPVEDGRLDVAVLDATGEIVIAAEAERSNNDTLRAVPADFDKMAACDPDQAIWVVEGRTEGHEVIRALHSPGDGEPRVEKTYSDSSPLSKVSIDESGFTDIYTIGTFRDRFLEEPPESITPSSDTAVGHVR